MPSRRSRGDGGLYWDRSRQRSIAEVTVGYTPSGKRIVKKASGKTKTAVQRKLKEIIRDYEDGLAIPRTTTPWPTRYGTGSSTGSAAAAPRRSRNARSSPTRM